MCLFVQLGDTHVEAVLVGVREFFSGHLLKLDLLFELGHIHEEVVDLAGPLDEHAALELLSENFLLGLHAFFEPHMGHSTPAAKQETHLPAAQPVCSVGGYTVLARLEHSVDVPVAPGNFHYTFVIFLVEEALNKTPLAHLD